MDPFVLFKALVISLMLIRSESNLALSCCVNITVAVLVERSPVFDFPFQINNSIGIIELAMNKTQEMVGHSANLKFIVRYADVPACTSLLWGALAAKIYHTNEIHAFIGPGKY